MDFFNTSTFSGQAMHFIGRWTAPTMCFLLVEGFYRNRKRYLSRLLIFAIISQLPFTYMQQQMLDDGMGWQAILASPDVMLDKGNVLFNLLALLALGAQHLPYKPIVRYAIITLLLLISAWMDWGVYLIIFSLVLAHFRSNRKQQLIAYLITAMGLLLLTDAGVIIGMPTVVLYWFPFGILLVPLFWHLYNGQRGHDWGGRYFFYIFYPAHMLILSLFAQYL